jgi:ferric-dicitrate binding protein FerR (iron transport regulator)
MKPYNQFTTDDFLLDDDFLAYCRGSDPVAVRFWQGWQQSSPQNLASFREAERLCRMLSAQKPRLDDSLAELEALLATRQPATVVRPLHETSRPARSLGWWAVAASFLIVSLFGVGGYWYWSNGYVTYKTAYNQQRTIKLPDDSVVQLNSHSTLKHRRNGFTNQMRQVELTGEGFFSVHHTATDAPFRVLTAEGFTVQVLGTEFTVYDRPARRRVVLNTGRIRVDFQDHRSPVTLRPGQLLEWETNSESIQLRSVHPEQYNAWMRQQMVFENVRLIEAVKTVEDQFGVRVRVDGLALGQRRFTGILPLNQPETILNAIAELNGLTLRRTVNEFILSE